MRYDNGGGRRRYPSWPMRRIPVDGWIREYICAGLWYKADFSTARAHRNTVAQCMRLFSTLGKRNKNRLLFQFYLISQIIPYRQAQKYVLINYSNLSENLLQTKQIFKLFISSDNHLVYAYKLIPFEQVFD